MRVDSVSFEGFRCLDDFYLTFDTLTAFVGANGTGKSSVLHALEWFSLGP